jgi:hypothetical protein
MATELRASAAEHASHQTTKLNEMSFDSRVRNGIPIASTQRHCRLLDRAFDGLTAARRARHNLPSEIVVALSLRTAKPICRKTMQLTSVGVWS